MNELHLPHNCEAEYSFTAIDDSRNNHPLPEVRTVQDEQNPEWYVQKMCPVEDLEREVFTI